MKQLKINHKGGSRGSDVLFINPGSLQDVYQGLASEFSAIETPSLIALFATYLIKHDFNVDILDAPAFGLSPGKVAGYINEYINPKLVVIVVYGYQPSASTQNMTAAGMTARELKKLNPDIRIIMTGTHPAALPEKCMDEEEIDYVCDGEGPQTLLKLADYVVRSRGLLSEIPNLLYREGATILRTPGEKLLTDLDDTLTMPAYELLPMEKYRAHNWHCFENIEQRQPYASIHTSLGCPYRCTFCCINAPFGKPSYRMWSPEAIIDQLDVLVNKYGVRNIKIVDEMFVLNRSHVLGICDEIIRKGYDLNIWAYARIDTIKDEYLGKLKDAGFRWLALGIESGSKHVRDGVEKGRFDTDDILEIVAKVKKSGINIIGNYIFGLPDDDLDTMRETLEMAKEANCEFANFYSAMAYPGSRLYSLAVERNWKLPESWLGYSQHSYECQPLCTEHISAAEVLKFRDEAFTEYFTGNRYLGMVKEKFGDEVVEHVNRMTQIKLERRIYS